MNHNFDRTIEMCDLIQVFRMVFFERGTLELQGLNEVISRI